MRDGQTYREQGQRMSVRDEWAQMMRQAGWHRRLLPVPAFYAGTGFLFVFVFMFIQNCIFNSWREL